MKQRYSNRRIPKPRNSVTSFPDIKQRKFLQWVFETRVLSSIHRQVLYTMTRPRSWYRNDGGDIQKILNEIRDLYLKEYINK